MSDCRPLDDAPLVPASRAHPRFQRSELTCGKLPAAAAHRRSDARAAAVGERGGSRRLGRCGKPGIGPQALANRRCWHARLCNSTPRYSPSHLSKFMGLMPIIPAFGVPLDLTRPYSMSRTRWYTVTSESGSDRRQQLRFITMPCPDLHAVQARSPSQVSPPFIFCCACLGGILCN